MIEFAFIPSKHLKIMLVVIHLLAFCAVFANSLPFMVQMLLAISIMGHFFWVRKNALPFNKLRFSEALGWEMAVSDPFVEIRVLPSTVITTFALFLHVEIGEVHTHISHSSLFSRIWRNDKRFLMILPDNVAQARYRELIVKLKTSYKINSKSANLLIESA